MATWPTRNGHLAYRHLPYFPDKLVTAVIYEKGLELWQKPASLAEES